MAMLAANEWIDQDNLVPLAVVLTLWLILILGSGWLVLKASTSPPPLALVLVLSVVTLVCIAAFVVTRDQVVLQLASVGLGAIAAAVATTWGVHQRDEQRRHDQQPPEDTKEDDEDGGV